MHDKDIFSESLELFRDMKQESSGMGEIECDNIIMEAERGGITRRIKYKLKDDNRIDFEFQGEHSYLNLPATITSREELFDFVDRLLQQVNDKIYPSKFVLNAKSKKSEKEKKAPEPETGIEPVIPEIEKDEEE